MKEKIPRGQLISGWIAAILIAAGTFFKLMHWPMATELLIIGTIGFILFYLPLWLINEPKKDRKLILTYQFIILFLSSATYLFKTNHWPFGGILFNLWMISSLYVLLPISIFQLLFAKNKTKQQFHQMIVYFLLGSLIIGGVGGSVQRSENMARSFSKNTIQIKNAINRLSTKNAQLYLAFEGLPDKENNAFYLKAVKLKKLTDSTETYLRQFRNHLVANVESSVEDVSESAADTMELEDIKLVTNKDIPTSLICGDDEYKPRTGKFSGLELKSVIEMFRDSVLNFAEGENKNFIKSGINLDTEPTVYDNGENEDWVFTTFKNIPLSVILLTMENFKYEVKNAETQVLTNLLNSTKQNSENLAVKVAELGAKLEDEKKQRDIEQLKSERELSNVNINAKNLQIEAQNKIIIFFVLGLLLFSVLIFFIIRSNLLRKKANLELKAQKHLIEEKQKEILDSINYAQRIQKSHLPTDVYIDSKLKKLMKG